MLIKKSKVNHFLTKDLQHMVLGLDKEEITHQEEEIMQDHQTHHTAL